MHARLIAAIFAIAALPVAAQVTTPAASEPRPAKVERALAQAPATPKQRAKAAKSQNKQAKKTAKAKADKQKKAPAT